MTKRKAGRRLKRLHSRHPVIDQNLAEIKELLKTHSVNWVGLHYGIDSTTMSRYAKIYKLQGVSAKEVHTIKWTDTMLSTLQRKFPTTFNRVLADELKVSIRTMIRKARELGIQKEDGFLDKRRAVITEMARVALPRPSQQIIDALKIAGTPYRFKKGENKNFTIDYSKIWETRRKRIAETADALKNPY